MISMVHDPVRDEIVEDDYPPIPAGGRRVEMDWDRVAAAFQSAVEHDRYHWCVLRRGRSARRRAVHVHLDRLPTTGLSAR